MRTLLLVILLAIVSTSPSTALDTENEQVNPEILVEFYDKYNEVKFSLTRNSLSLELDIQTWDFNNKELTEDHNNDMESFMDSGGEFIIGNKVVMTSNKIEYDLEDIKNIKFNNGNLNFEYHSKSDLGFEDIISRHGNKVIENFYIEDLERLAFTFIELRR